MPTHGGVKNYDEDSPDDVYYQNEGSGSTDSGGGSWWSNLFGGGGSSSTGNSGGGSSTDSGGSSGDGSVWAGLFASLANAAGSTYSSIYAADAAAEAERERAQLDLQGRIASINAQGKWILPASGLVLALIIWLIVVAIKRRKRK